MAIVLTFTSDTGSFGSLQALPSFLSRFGEDDGTGKFALPALRGSLLNSLPWIGKFSGCLLAERVIEGVGYKKTMYITACIQFVGLIIQMTAYNWVQFSVGRIVTYFAVALVENGSPSYNAEISPPSVRGWLAGSLIMITSIGNLWGAGMSRAYATETTAKGWLIPTAMQFIPAVGLIALVPFTQESPRWLILHDRKDEAQRAIDKLRPSRDVHSGATRAEVDAIESLIKESLATEEGSWLDLFRGNYLRRTWIAATLFVIEQTNGNQFVQSYAATFYKQEGLGSRAFTYATIGQVVGIVGCVVGLILFDTAGRRPPMIYGSLFCMFLLYLASGLGSIKAPSQNDTNMLLACFMLLPAFTRISAGNTSFLTGSEIGGVRMRRKIMAFGTACDVLAAFLVTFVTPYLLPIMGVKIGWIFGSVAAFAVVWSALFFPELKGRSLEEVDELFAAKIPAWAFKKHETFGTGRLLTEIENEGKAVDESESVTG